MLDFGNAQWSVYLNRNLTGKTCRVLIAKTGHKEGIEKRLEATNRALEAISNFYTVYISSARAQHTSHTNDSGFPASSKADIRLKVDVEESQNRNQESILQPHPTSEDRLHVCPQRRAPFCIFGINRTPHSWHFHVNSHQNPAHQIMESPHTHHQTRLPSPKS